MAEQDSRPPSGMNPGFNLGDSIKDALTRDDHQRNFVDTLQRVDDKLFIDDKSGLFNERAFNMKLSEMIEDVEPGQSIVVSMWDIEYFKAVNDELGHTRGDELLSIIGNVFDEVFQRSSDVKAHLSSRLHGDEFASAMLHNAENYEDHDPVNKRTQSPTEETDSQALRINERLREVLGGTEFEHFNVSISHGCAVYEPGDSIGDVLARADFQMMMNKHESHGDKITPEEEEWLSDTANIDMMRRLGLRFPVWVDTYLKSRSEP